MTLNRTLIVSIAMAVGAFAALPASAEPYNHGGRSPQERIDRGIRNGSLTPREAAQLRQEQREIDARIARAKRDGHVDYFERAQIARMKAAASRHIYQEKHDAEGVNRRYGSYGYGYGSRRWW
jgi:uncharacterized membrane protein YebE (DUF533 family)